VRQRLQGRCPRRRRNLRGGRIRVRLVGLSIRDQRPAVMFAPMLDTSHLRHGSSPSFSIAAARRGSLTRLTAQSRHIAPRGIGLTSPSQTLSVRGKRTNLDLPKTRISTQVTSGLMRRTCALTIRDLQSMWSIRPDVTCVEIRVPSAGQGSVRFPRTESVCEGMSGDPTRARYGRDCAEVAFRLPRRAAAIGEAGLCRAAVCVRA